MVFFAALLMLHDVAAHASAAFPMFENVGKEFLAYVGDDESRALIVSNDFESNDPANIRAPFAKAVSFATDKQSGRLFCSALKEYGISDVWWCARALIVTAGKPDSDFSELSRVIAAALIDKLDSKPPFENPPKECGADTKYYPATRWNESEGDAWFRDRSAFWVRCQNNVFMVFLPERGWFVPPSDFLPN